MYNISLKNLLHNVNELHGISYILTRKLNQDVLEHLYSFLKGMVGSASSNITSLDFKNWYVILPWFDIIRMYTIIKYYIFNHFSLRWFILGKYSNVVFTNNTNSEQCIETNLLEENDCLTSKLIADSNLEEND